MSDLKASMFIAGAGLQAQNERLKVIAENIANAETVASSPDEDPYRRKTIHFKNVFDEKIGANVLKIDHVEEDSSEFGEKYDPGHPAANESGYIKTPNVNTVIETADQREAMRTYEANLSTIETTKTMIRQTLQLLQ